MSNLTEQYKKGKLPSGWYYIEIFDFVKNKKVADIDFWRGLTWQENREDSVLQIIAPVPSYEWVVEHSFKPFSQREFEKTMAKNMKLKHTLQKARIHVAIDAEDYEDRTPSKAEKAEAKKLLTEIDEVLQ